MNIPKYVDDSHRFLWPQFCNWCANNGVPENEEDMKAWWECFIAGATVMYLKFKSGEVE